MAGEAVGRNAYIKSRHLAADRPVEASYSGDMGTNFFKTRRWMWLGLLAGLAIAVLGLARAGAAPDAAAAVEIVYGEPLAAGHSLAVQSNGTQASAQTGGRARAYLPEDYYDFGSLALDALVQHDFLLVNRGTAPLEIRAAYTTCGCTTAEVSASVIPPGKAARARLVFDAGFHPLPGQTVRRGLILETNDPDRPLVEIWVQARIKS